MEEQWSNAISFDGHPNDNTRNSISLLIYFEFAMYRIP